MIIVIRFKKFRSLLFCRRCFLSFPVLTWRDWAVDAAWLWSMLEYKLEVLKTDANCVNDQRLIMLKSVTLTWRGWNSQRKLYLEHRCNSHFANAQYIASDLSNVVWVCHDIADIIPFTCNYLFTFIAFSSIFIKMNPHFWMFYLDNWRGQNVNTRLCNVKCNNLTLAALSLLEDCLEFKNICYVRLN